MDSATKFASPLAFSSNSMEEIITTLEGNKVTDTPMFLEEFEVLYDEGQKIFLANVEGDEKLFTRQSFLEFCGLLAIPTAFAERVPNELLFENLKQLLDDNNRKVRFGCRGDVVAYARKDSYVNVDPMEFLKGAKGLLDNHLFREGSVSDAGSTFHYEPLTAAPLAPNLENPEDRFNVGAAFTIGFSSGRIAGSPYSLRHICTNVAITAPMQAKYKLVERIKPHSDAETYFERLLENYGSEYYQNWIAEVNVRLAKALDARMTDFTYYNTYRALNSEVGKESALALMHITEERHKEIMDDVQYRKKKNAFDKDHQIDLEEGVYEIFNSITDAAKGYDGSSRSVLQTIGGELI